MLAQYIINSYDKAAFMTAAKLGQTVGISESTVVRFAGELGFDGYPGLQKAMQTMLSNQLAPEQHVEMPASKSDLISNVFHAEMEKMHRTAALLDRETFDNVIKTLANGQSVYIIGTGNNRLLAEHFGRNLRLTLQNVHIISGATPAEMMENLLCVGSKDVVIGINFPQYSTSTEKAMQYCRSTGATVVGFTDNRSSQFTKCCDYVLYAKCDDIAFGDSLVAPLCLINALIIALAEVKEKTLSERLTVLDRICDTYNIQK